MKISYNWLKWYIPEVPEPEKLRDIFTYHLCEVEGIEKREDGDVIFDINILPNRAHDLLSHQGIARELASQLDIQYVDPTSKYKIPKVNQAKSTNLKIKLESENCRRYMGRIVRNIKVGPSPDWVRMHLESIGERSINNVVDASNIVLFDSGQPTHCFDLDKTTGAIIVRQAVDGEELTTLDNKQVKLTPNDLVIADEKNVLAIAGVKGGKVAEVDENTNNIIIEVANFDPTSVRKTGKGARIFTDALKRFENDLSPTLCDFGMLEISGLLVEYGFTDFEDIIDTYPKKQEERKLSFKTEKISKMLGLEVGDNEIENILKRYNFKFENNSGVFEIEVPPMRLDLEIEEDMAEEIGRIIGYDKVISKIPKIDFKPKINETYSKILWARNKLLIDGYSEVMTYTFCDKGEVGVFESASDKKFLRTNLSDGLKESFKLNKLNLPLLSLKEVKIFEIGTVWCPKEEIHVGYNEGDKFIEMELSKFIPQDIHSESTNISLLGNFSARASRPAQGSHNENPTSFKIWSLFPFIVRDIAVWVPEGISSNEVAKIIKDAAGELRVKGPDLFDEFKKGEQVSFAFRTVFQSFERTLTDDEINEIMLKIQGKIGEKEGWQVR